MKQPIILIHGLFGSLSNWESTLQHLNGRFDVHIPELPIYLKYNEDSLTYFVRFLDDYINSNRLEHVVLIGNSLGGHLAIRYTAEYPGKVAKLVLTGSSGLYENTQWGSYLKRANYDYIRERVAFTFYDPAIATDEMVREVMGITTDRTKCLAVIKAAKSAQRDNVAHLLPAILVPALLIWGANDQITPPDVAATFRHSLVHSRLIMLQECGHAPMMERPDEFNAALDGFL